MLHNLVEALHPGPAADHPLLIEDDERVLDLDVLADVVPTVDNDVNALQIERPALIVPLMVIALASRGDDEQRPATRILLDEICDSRTTLPRPDPTT